MCEKCKELLKCPVGEKRKVEVQPPYRAEDIDYYGKKIFAKPWVMYLQRWSNGEVDCSLYQDVYDENFVHYDSHINIAHCPFCGELLKGADT